MRSLKAVTIEHFLETDGQYLGGFTYFNKRQLTTLDGDELYIDPTSEKNTS